MNLDGLACRIVLAILAALALQFACSSAHAAPVGGLVPGDYCDPDDGGRSWTRAQKQRTRDRVAKACEYVGGSPLYCEFWQAAITRESWGGVASAVHTRGTDVDGDTEDGLGPLGISRKWHASKWPGDDELPALCTPEVSFLIGHAIALRAVEAYGASTLVEIQAVYGGGVGVVRCRATGLPSWLRWFGFGWLVERTAGSECEIRPTGRHVAAVCDRMRWEDCTRPITREDLGHTDLVARDGWQYVVTAKGRAWALSRE